MTRHQTYQTEYGFITIDTETEQPPDEFISGPFDVNLDEADQIDQGADLEVTEDGLQITPQPLEGEVL